MPGRCSARRSRPRATAQRRKPDSFDGPDPRQKDYPRLTREGQTILRAGHVREWDPDDLQSFTPLRFYPPQAMGFEGRAVMTDPDIFARRRRR